MRNWLLSTVLIRKCDRKCENQWWEISLLIRWCVLGPRSANKTVVPQRDVRPDCDYSFECVVDRATFLICSNWKKNNMPKSNHLPFLRPLYDIAVWQFILMIGAQGDTKFTYKMHMVVANFVCKLLETRPFSHLKDKMITEEVKLLTDNWMPGERATTKLVEWCQDQWRRKELAFPNKNIAYAVNEPSTLPWFVDMPVCFNCGVPCPECRTDLNMDIPEEMFTVRSIRDYNKIHEMDVTNDVDDPSDDDITEARQPPVSEPTSTRMILRSSHNRN